jgi:hypothetical protein
LGAGREAEEVERLDLVGFRWTSGFLVGCVFAFFVIARMSPPAWIENWQDGAFGEQWTAKSLRPLESRGWVVLHDLPGERGNLDHVVVGPGGVFLLDSKRWRGTTTVSGDIATVRRLEDPELSYRLGGVGHLKGLAREVHDRLRTESRLNRWVEPVIVIWGDFPQRVAGETCNFVHGDHLASWLEEQPKRIDASRVDQVALAIDRGWIGGAASGQ